MRGLPGIRETNKPAPGPAAKRSDRLSAGLNASGNLLAVLGLFMLLPAAVGMLYGETRAATVFTLVGVATALVGTTLARRFRPGIITWRTALVLCVGAWVACSLTGGLPIHLAMETPYLDSVFEATSGFTTTGLTLFDGLDKFPKSILLWRVLMQWIGGLGIFSLFLLVSFPGGEAYRLLMMEGPKTLVDRPTPGVRGTLVILWSIYLGLTVLNIIALLALGAGGFNSITYALSTISTGGFGMHDANLGFFASSGHPNALWIELTTMVFMLLSGVGYLSHYLLIKGRPRHAIYGPETRSYWSLLLLCTLVLALEGCARQAFPECEFGPIGSGMMMRSAAFQSASLLSGAGFSTRPLADWLSLPASFQILMVLMLVGGCIGSTSGGLKILRARVLVRMAWHDVRRYTFPSNYVMPFTLGGQIMPDDGVRRMAVVAVCWAALVAAGAILLGLVTDTGALEAFTLSLSAVSNMGPCLVSSDQVTSFPVVAKLLCMVLMVAGRLEIIPVLALFSKRVWR